VHIGLPGLRRRDVERDVAPDTSDADLAADMRDGGAQARSPRQHER
jgi:hypothetical protein